MKFSTFLLIIHFLYCQIVSTASPVKGTCDLPPVNGNCRGRFERYFFNTTTKNCQKFIYTGCGGNFNNFRSVMECKHECVKKKTKQRCKLKVDKGPCRSFVTRFYFDSTSSTCQKFNYGGCGGNSNNFKSEFECQKICKTRNPCELAPLSGPCKGAFVKYYYHSATGVCRKFIFGGCEGNANNFRSWKECSKACHNPCKMKADRGPCRSILTRFYYNSTKGICDRFTFGGCGGNRNNFVTLKDCLSFCKARI